MKTELKRIAVSRKNYHRLKLLGHAGDSFNDVVTKLLEKESHEEDGVGIAPLHHPPYGPLEGTQRRFPH
jgi:hypothetical protein